MPKQREHPQWQPAKNLFHNLRETDKYTALFKCFTCHAWFDGSVQLDLNFHVTSTEVTICPIAQAMMFDC
jgi:hypothetical protein